MFKVCEKCQSYKTCPFPCTSGHGNKEPKLIIILDTPSYQDASGENFFENPVGNLLEKTLGEYKDSVYITYLVKCVPLRDLALPERGTRELQSSEIEHCKTILIRELKQFSEDIPIVAMGNHVLYALDDSFDTGIAKEVGVVRNCLIGNRTFKVFPNYHPYYIFNSPTAYTKFELVFNKILNKKSVASYSYKLLDHDESINKINELIELYDNKKIDYVVFDIETDNLIPWGKSLYLDGVKNSKSIMISLSTTNDDISYSIPLVINNIIDQDALVYSLDKEIGMSLEDKQTLVDQYTVKFNLDHQKIANINRHIDKLMTTIPLVGHNLKFDIKFRCYERAIDPMLVKVYADTLIDSHLKFGKVAGQSLKLKDICRRIFDVAEDWEIVKDKYLSKIKGLKDNKHFGLIPTKMLGEYAALDVHYTKLLLLYLEKNIPPQVQFLRKQVTDAITPFVEAEIKGIYTSKNTYEDLLTYYSDFLKSLLEEISEIEEVKKLKQNKLEQAILENKKKRKPKTIDELAQKSFSITSKLDLINLIYSPDYFGSEIVEGLSTDKGNPKTSEDAIQILLKTNKNENAQKFFSNYLKYKEILTLKERYLDSFPEESVNGAYHSDFHLTGTVTGRVSSGFHTLPSKSDLKRVFTSRWLDDGGLFLCADASQLEIRVVSSLANESTFIEAYNKGMDIHSKTAQLIYGKEEVSSKERKVGKTINFGILYGISPDSIANDLSISKEEANSILNKFYDGAKELKAWIDAQHQFVRKYGLVVTPFYRAIQIPEGMSSSWGERSHGERRSVNNVCQSTASDAMLMANNWTFYDLKKKGLKSIFLGMVHDSTEFDVYPGELIDVISLIKNNFEAKLMNDFSAWMQCPLAMDFSIGTSWGGAIEFKIVSLNDNMVVLEGEGMSIDCLALKKAFRKAYKIEFEVLEEAPIDINKFPNDIFYRDCKNWKIRVSLSKE